VTLGVDPSIRGRYAWTCERNTNLGPVIRGAAIHRAMIHEAAIERTVIRGAAIRHAVATRRQTALGVST
jgi:hypothetical protein